MIDVVWTPRIITTSICHQFACNRCKRMPFKGVRERFFGSSGWNLGKFEATIILYRDFHLLLSYLSGQNVISLSLSLSRWNKCCSKRERKKRNFSIGSGDLEIGAGSSRRLAEVMGAKLFRPFYRRKLAWMHTRANRKSSYVQQGFG